MQSVSISQSNSITFSSSNQSSFIGKRNDNLERSAEDDSAIVHSAPDDHSTSRNINHSIGNEQKVHSEFRHEENNLLGGAALPITSRNLKWCNEV